jgi:hypothetical protein
MMAGAVRNSRRTLVWRARHSGHMLIHCKGSLEVLRDIGDACAGQREHEGLLYETNENN